MVVIESYLHGLSRAEIAAKYRISTGSVSHIIKEYEEALAIGGLTTIRKDLKLIHKSGFTIKECAQASRFLFLMKEFFNTKDTTDLQDFQKYITNVVESITNIFKFCTQNNIDPAIMPLWIKDLQDFAPNMHIIAIKQSKLDSEPGIDIFPTNIPSPKKLKRNTNIPFISAVSLYIENLKREREKLQYHNNILVESVRRPKDEATKSHTRLEQLNQKEEQAMHYLDWYYKLKAELENNPAGAQIDDIKHFTKAINELEIRGYRASYIISELEELESAPWRLFHEEWEIGQLLDKKNGIKREIEIYKMRFPDFLGGLNTLFHLEKMGLGEVQLLRLIRIVESTSRLENISLKEAVNRFLKRIEQQYWNERDWYF